MLGGGVRWGVLGEVCGVVGWGLGGVAAAAIQMCKHMSQRRIDLIKPFFKWRF
jgi:hypothetical protein